MKRTWRTLVSLTVLGAVLAGCSGDDDGDGAERAGDAPVTSVSTTEVETPLTGSYVGTAAGTETYVAVVVAPDGDARAFVTDGGESIDWLEGQVFGDSGTLSNDGGTMLKVSFADNGVSGTFTRVGSEPLTVTAEAADAPAGLYRAEESFADGFYKASWVVLPDGTQRGAVRRLETPLSPGEVDTVLDLDNPTVVVPGGVLTLDFVDPATLY